MTRRGPEERRILELAAERQMRRWTLEGEVSRRLAREGRRGPESISEYVRPWIAISREAGTGGHEVGRLVAERLGWEVLGRELLGFMAERYHLPRHMLEVVDETAANWFHEIFGKWLDQQAVTQGEYVLHLGKIQLLAAQHGRVVFVGRGAQFLLPRASGLTVRLIASRAFRIRQIAERHGLGTEAAERRMDEVDGGRNEFVRHYFDRDPTDPHLYDLVVSLDRLARLEAASLIADLHRARQAAA